MIPSGERARPEEQEFLLRSLEDLEDERAAGNIDDATYDQLHSDYTARAAVALRAEPAVPSGPSRRVSAARRTLTVVAIVGFALVAALVLASALGARLPGRTSSGNSGAVSDAEQRRTLERAVAERPDDVQAHLALARFFSARSKYADAFREFAAAATRDPANAEAQAYSGWLAYLAGLQDQALQRLDAAIAADETYPDAHFFKGVVLFRGRNDPTGAVPQFQRYLTLVPDGPLADQVRQLLAAAVTATRQH